MPRAETLAAVREKYPQYKDMSDDALGSALAAKYPQYADLAPAPSAPKAEPEGALHHVGRIVKEEAAKVPGRVREDIAGIAESVANPKMTTLLPLTLGPGSTVASRLGALGAGAMLDKPSSSPSENIGTAAKNIAAGGVSELFAGLIPRVKIPLAVAGKMGEAAEAKAARQRAYEWAKEAPAKALDALRDRLPKGKWLNVPSLSKKKMTVDEAVAGLQKLEGLDYQTARAEIISEFNALDIQRAGAADLARKGPRPYAGQAFGIRTSPEVFTPPKGSAFERFSESVVPALNDPALRTAADLAATQDVGGGLPAGLVPPAALLSGGEGFGRLARHLIHVP